MPNYTRTNLSTEITALATGSFTSTDFATIANRAVKDVLLDIDLRSAKRTSILSPNLFDEIFEYTCPTDMKGNKIIDIQPQINRSRQSYWKLTTAEEFDRYKEEDPTEKNLVAFGDDSMVRKLLISRYIDDHESSIDSFNSVGDWEAFGDGTNLTKDSDNFVKGNASLNWDINSDGNTTAGISNASLTAFDVSDYLMTGSIFVWVYISSTTNLTNFIIRIGSSAAAYYSITITTDNSGNSFAAGWNLLRFDFTDKVETGTVDDDACTYVALYMTKDALKVDETDYRFDTLVMKRGQHYKVVYYSKYGWVSSTGTYLENSTEDTDLLIVDTEEYAIVIEKTLQLMEEHLKNFNEAERHEKRYLNKLLKYQLDNPSEAMILMQTYYDL
jgi:hypothetical protein